MDLTISTIPATEEKVHGHGVGVIDVEGHDKLVIRTNGLEHLRVDVPNGKTYRFRIEVSAEEV